MVVEIRRYLGNTLRAHIHDADDEHPNCHLGRISSENRLGYDSPEEARSRHGLRRLLLVHGQIRRPRVGWGGDVHDPRTLKLLQLREGNLDLGSGGGHRGSVAALRDAI